MLVTVFAILVTNILYHKRRAPTSKKIHQDIYSVANILKLSPTVSYQHDFSPEKSLELYKRLTSGDLQGRYLQEVVYHDAHSQPEKDAMMSVVNIMCGNIDLECAQVSYQYSLTAYYDPGKFLF